MFVPTHKKLGATNVHDDGGFTVVEAIVAALVMMLGVMATFQVLDVSTTNTARAKALQIALNTAQQELERLRAVPYDEVALTVTPAGSSDPNDPRSRVSGGSFNVSRSGVADYEPLVVNGGSLYGGGYVTGGVVNPGPQAFSSGDVTGKLYRFVVWRDDPRCSPSICGGSQDFKRVIVAVRLDTPANSSYERRYVEVQSDLVDPAKTQLNEPAPGPDEPLSAQQFFLSDTACEADGTTARIPITGEHLLHNTLGTCASGLQSGTALGAPDALFLGAPPDPAPDDPLDPATFDYSNDFYLEPSPDTDKGLQIRRQNISGCNYTPSGENPESRIHRWVTDPMPADFQLSGNAILEFYTRTINDAAHTGRMCVYLFRRSESGTPPVATDTRFINTGGSTIWANGQPYFSYPTQGSGGLWPRNGWGKLRLDMRFSAVTIPAGQRLGIALSVDREITQGDALSVLYDHPNQVTRLEVQTTTPILGD